jgi:hypothetical protein
LNSHLKAIEEYHLAMVQIQFKAPVSWSVALKSRAISRPGGVSGIVREALALWADENELNLRGF